MKKSLAKVKTNQLDRTHRVEGIADRQQLRRQVADELSHDLEDDHAGLIPCSGVYVARRVQQEFPSAAKTAHQVEKRKDLERVQATCRSWPLLSPSAPNWRLRVP